MYLCTKPLTLSLSRLDPCSNTTCRDQTYVPDEAICMTSRTPLCHLHPPPLALHWMHAAHSSPNTHLTCDLRLRVCPSMSSMLYTVVSLASTQAYEHPCYASSSRRALLTHERSYIPAHQLSALSYRPAPGYARHRSTPRLI